MKYEVPCRQGMGHGESCTEGYLCSGCAEVTRLRAVIEQAMERMLKEQHTLFEVGSFDILKMGLEGEP